MPFNKISLRSGMWGGGVWSAESVPHIVLISHTCVIQMLMFDTFVVGWVVYALHTLLTVSSVLRILQNQSLFLRHARRSVSLWVYDDATLVDRWPDYDLSYQRHIMYIYMFLIMLLNMPYVYIQYWMSVRFFIST